MKIVIINSGTRGPASYSLNLYKYLTKAGHDVLVVSEWKWHKEPIPLYQAHSFQLFGLAPIVYKPGELVNAIKDFKPDIIHHQWPSGTMDILFWKIIKLGIPTAVTIHVAVGSRNFLWDKIFYYHFSMFKKYLPIIQATVSISKFIEKQVLSRVKLQSEKTSIIYAGVDSDLFKPEKKNNTRLEVLFVGQIMPEKGIDVLVDAVIEANKKRPVRLTIVGDGHLRKILEKKTKSMDCIIWVGFVKEQKKLADYYKSADLTALPTRWDEAFSLVPVESMACGTPVLSTNKGGNPEIVINKKTGYLIESCEKQEITKILVTTKKSDLETYGNNARELVLKRHTFEIWGKQHEKLYERLIKK